MGGQPVPGFGPPSVQVGITPSDTDDIATLTSGKMPYARGLNVETSGIYSVTDLSGNHTSVFLTAGYNPCPCVKVWAAGSVSASGIVALY